MLYAIVAAALGGWFSILCLSVFAHRSIAHRAVTLHLMSWDTTSNGVAFDATYTLPDIPDVPVGWQHYEVPIDAQSATIPAGWVITRGDGTPATDADWATFMHQIDLVGFGYWKPGFFYPSLGLWQLGIDNIHNSAQP